LTLGVKTKSHSADANESVAEHPFESGLHRISTAGIKEYRRI
jgi:hypothetical protein